MWNYGLFSYMILKKCLFSEGFVSILNQGPPPADNSCRVNVFLSTSCCACNWASAVILDNFAGFARLFCVLLYFALLYIVLNFDFILSLIFLLPHKFPCCSEHVCIPEQCSVCCSSIPRVGKAYVFTGTWYIWLVFQTLQFRLRKPLRMEEQIFSFPHHKIHQQTRTIIEDYV